LIGKHIELTPSWCNGNTGDFGSLFLGSNPSEGIMTDKIIAWSIIGTTFAIGIGIFIYGVKCIIEDWKEK
jgi:hypothetical protein